MIDPAVLALAAAASFAGAGVFLRRALATVTPPTAALVSVSFTATFVWIVSAATVPLSRLAAPEVLLFLVAGLFAPGLARLVYYLGLARVGVARSTALISVAPLFAVGLAIAALGERPGARAIAGVACVVAALGFAIRDIVSRHGLATYPEPMLAAAAATFASVVLMWSLAAARVVPFVRPSAAGLGYVALSGLCESLAYLTMWRALAAAPVSLVSPLVHAQPLFTIVLAAVFLRDLERMTWRIVLASLLIGAGVTFVMRFT